MGPLMGNKLFPFSIWVYCWQINRSSDLYIRILATKTTSSKGKSTPTYLEGLDVKTELGHLDTNLLVKCSGTADLGKMPPPMGSPIDGTNRKMVLPRDFQYFNIISCKVSRQPSKFLETSKTQLIGGYLCSGPGQSGLAKGGAYKSFLWIQS